MATSHGARKRKSKRVVVAFCLVCCFVLLFFILLFCFVFVLPFCYHILFTLLFLFCYFIVLFCFAVLFSDVPRWIEKATAARCRSNNVKHMVCVCVLCFYFALLFCVAFCLLNFVSFFCCCAPPSELKKQKSTDARQAMSNMHVNVCVLLFWPFCRPLVVMAFVCFAGGGGVRCSFVVAFCLVCCFVFVLFFCFCFALLLWHFV